MKLSDIKGDSVIDVIADLVEPVANIAIDDEASELFTRKPLPVGMTAKEFMAQRIKKAVPALLKGHKEDCITILATISQESVEDYRSKLTIVSLLKDMTDLLTDDVFTQLFTSAQTSEPDEHSGSAPESTEAEQQEA